ncbi:hypothetical protein BDV96DRAFT_646743 [Lophiotrema nucula]|uniref:Uncharacterized protein n=1 Tax=Lophiotrema nucula TaxID=690887 RepID=A0A6A5Z6U0_9PLEO|nr:hypothetical protein BDV96DRAFT_646743 [Lophiotrema nucula]
MLIPPSRIYFLPSPAKIQTPPFSFLGLSKDIRLMVYDEAASIAPQHRRTTIDLRPRTDLDSYIGVSLALHPDLDSSDHLDNFPLPDHDPELVPGQTELIWVTTILPWSLLSTCRLINQEASPNLAKTLNKLCLEPLRFIVDAKGLQTLTGDYGLIAKVLAEVVRIERGTGVDGQLELMRESPRLFGFMTLVFQSVEIDYLVLDCARQIVRQRALPPKGPVEFEIAVTYKDPASRSDAIEITEKFWQQSMNLDLPATSSVTFGLFLKEVTTAGSDNGADHEWMHLKSRIAAQPEGCTILECTEEGWLRDWTEIEVHVSSR